MSLLPPPRCMETIGTSLRARHARQPAGHHGERSRPSPPRRSRKTTGRGSSRCRCQTGAVESATCSCATKSSGRARNRGGQRRLLAVARACGRRPVPAPRSETPASTTSWSRCSSTYCSSCALAAPPGRRPTAAAALRPAGAGTSAGRNGRSAGVSITPVPSALATATLPARTASTSPATPRNESPRSSSGSQKLSSSRRKMTSTGCRPSSVLRKTRRSRTVRSPPSTSVKPR